MSSAGALASARAALAALGGLPPWPCAPASPAVGALAGSAARFFARAAAGLAPSAPLPCIGTRWPPTTVEVHSASVASEGVRCDASSAYLGLELGVGVGVG